MPSLDTKRYDNIFNYNGGSYFPFYIAPFKDTYFSSKLIPGETDSGVEIYFEIDLEDMTNFEEQFGTEHPPIIFQEDYKLAVKNAVKAKLRIGSPLQYYSSDTYSDVYESVSVDLLPGQINRFTYTELQNIVTSFLDHVGATGNIDLGDLRVCFYLDVNEIFNYLSDAEFSDPGSIKFPYDIKIKNLYMEKLVIPYIEPPKLEIAKRTSLADNKELVIDATVTAKDSSGTSLTGTDYKFVPQYYSREVSMKGFTVTPKAPQANDPHATIIASDAGYYNRYIETGYTPELKGATMCVFDVDINRFTNNITPYIVDFEYTQSPSDYGLTSYPIYRKAISIISNTYGLIGAVAYIRREDLINFGLTEIEADSAFSKAATNNLILKYTNPDGSLVDIIRIYYITPHGSTSGGGLNYTINNILGLFNKNPDGILRIRYAIYNSVLNEYLGTKRDASSTYYYTPKPEFFDKFNIVVGLEISTSVRGKFTIDNKLETIYELPSIQEVGFLQVGAYASNGNDGEYACYRIYASKDKKVWDYLGDSVGMQKTKESSDYMQYLSIDISNIAEPDPTKTYSKIKGRYLKVSVPDNNMYLRNINTGVVTPLNNGKEFAIRDIVINNSGSILDFTLTGLTKLTYKGEVFNGTDADTKFAQILKDTDFLNIDYNTIKAEGSDLLIDLGSEKEFDTVNIITGRTTVDGIVEMKYNVTISSDGSSFKNVINMDPEAFTPSMFLKRTGILTLNNNVFFTDDSQNGGSTPPLL